MTTDDAHDELPGLRRAPLERWLADHAVDIDTSTPLDISLLTGGRSNVTYRLTDAGGRSVVLRRPPLGHVMPSAHDMSREFRVIAGLGRVGYPVPAALAECTDASVIGAPFVVMGFVDGTSIHDRDDAAALDASEADTVSATLVGALADLHRVDVEAAGLTDLGRPQGYLERQVRRWAQQWELSKVAEQPAVDALRDWLQVHVARVPTDLPWSVVHGDFRLDNVIVDPDLVSARAVLDWEMSTLGDPVVDLAVALVYWSQAGDGLRARVPVALHVTDGPGFWSRSRVVEGYAARSGHPLDHLDVATALACFKLAVIMESIRFRALSGQQLGSATSDEQEDLGGASAALAELGLAVTRHGTIDGLAR